MQLLKTAAPEHASTDASAPVALPRHDEFSVLRRLFEAACLAIAVSLLGVHLFRLSTTAEIYRWWMPLAALGGLFAADWFSGLVHWIADTWGRETMPLLGRRFLRPFRVHHVNPDDFLRRTFLDTNGDVALLVIPFLAACFLLPLDAAWGRVASVSIVAFCIAGLPTNQVHQWAHMPRPPRWVRRLQECGIILSYAEHAKHHRAPYAMNYCIATGWCNRALTAIDFFPRLERILTALFGIEPRRDDAAFQRESQPCVAGAADTQCAHLASSSAADAAISASSNARSYTRTPASEPWK